MFADTLLIVAISICTALFAEGMHNFVVNYILNHYRYNNVRCSPKVANH